MPLESSLKKFLIQLERSIVAEANVGSLSRIGSESEESVLIKLKPVLLLSAFLHRNSRTSLILPSSVMKTIRRNNVFVAMFPV